jgi:hypothetical protein
VGFVSVTYHKYLRKGELPPPEARARGNGQSAKEKLDAEWRRKRIDAESARQRLHEAKLLAMKGELISRRHAQKQSTFLVLSLRARLLAIPEQHADELLGISDRREMALRLNGIIRGALETLADMPLKVTDPDWLREVDDESEAPPQAKRPKRAAK